MQRSYHFPLQIYNESEESRDAFAYKNAMHEEIESLEERNVRELTDLPEGKSFIWQMSIQMVQWNSLQSG